MPNCRYRGNCIDGSIQGTLDRPLNLVNLGFFSRVPAIFVSNQDDGLFDGEIFPRILFLK